MEFDFCLVASWAELSHRQLVAWAEELRNRGYHVAMLSPVSSGILEGSDVRTFVLNEHQPTAGEYPSVEALESRYGIPSMDHLTFTERLYFGLSRSEALARGVRLATALEKVFSEHSVRYTVQVRGPEIHRLLAHYLTEAAGGASVWCGFSPFDDRFALSTSLDGAWDDYSTIPYEDIPEDSRDETRRHIEQFREERRFYAHDNDETTEGDDGEASETTRSVITQCAEYAKRAVSRTRPGKLRDQILQEASLELNSRINERFLPSIEESRQRCRDERYVFFPLQYAIESRLTVFSPQFYDQTYMIEYLSRVLPSSVQLFVKGHPNHPGRPGPRTIHQLREDGRVRFLSHGLNAHAVIENAEAVVVVNNTVGYETIYHGKPLLALGDPPYAETPAVTHVSDLDELPERLSDCLSTSVPESQVVESIYSLKEASYPGNRADLSPGSVRQLADSILEFVDEGAPSLRGSE